MVTVSDLSVAARQLTALLESIDDQQLTAPTPCTDFTVRDMLVHLLGLTQAFRHAATKTPSPRPEMGGEGGAELAEWRTRLPEHLDSLVAAWQDPDAWTGMTEVGRVSLTGATAGGFALNELLLHGWDLATATGQPFHCDPSVAEAALGFTTEIIEGGFGDVYGALVKIPDDASTLDRLLGLAGRNPTWTAT